MLLREIYRRGDPGTRFWMWYWILVIPVPWITSAVLALLTFAGLPVIIPSVTAGAGGVLFFLSPVGALALSDTLLQREYVTVGYHTERKGKTRLEVILSQPRRAEMRAADLEREIAQLDSDLAKMGARR